MVKCTYSDTTNSCSHLAFNFSDPNYIISLLSFLSFIFSLLWYSNLIFSKGKLNTGFTFTFPKFHIYKVVQI